MTAGHALLAVKVAQAHIEDVANCSYGLALQCEPGRRTEHPQAHLRQTHNVGWPDDSPRRHDGPLDAPNLPANSWHFGGIGLFSADLRCRPRPVVSSRGVVQPKLLVGAADDPLEREADVVADAALRMPNPGPSISATGIRVSRRCTECEHEGKDCADCEQEGEDKKETNKVRMRPAAAAPASAVDIAPPRVHDVLRQPGRPLDATTRRFFERQFRCRLTDVRIHDDAKAAISAAELGARAYTVGSDVVFGAEGYRPRERAGLSLLAHELVHVIQQGSGTSTLRRAPCRSPSQCAVATPGDTGWFMERAAAQQEATARGLAAAPPGSAGATLLGRSGQRATNIEALLSANSVPLQPETLGFFINAAIGGSAGAQTDKCRNFPGARPPAAPVTEWLTKWCVQVPAELEDQAASLLGPAPSEAEKTRILNIIAIATHEMQHAHFQYAGIGAIVPAADCDANTVVLHGPTTRKDYTVGFYLGEISAITSEFQVYYQNLMRSPGAAAQAALELEVQQQAFDPGESLRGCIAGLQCACSCETVESLVRQTVDATTAGWPADQKSAFLKAMTQKIPGLWPKALHQR
jgi:hypothetical protein